MSAPVQHRQVSHRIGTPSALLMLLTAAVFSSIPRLAAAQAFAGAKSALVDYSKADLAPRDSCESVARYGSKDLREIHAEWIAAAESAPAFCRVTGVLAPEIAFEIGLPERWNGRFYMIGNGGLAGESLEDQVRVAQRNAALQVGFAFAQTNTGHDARKEPGGGDGFRQWSRT